MIRKYGYIGVIVIVCFVSRNTMAQDTIPFECSISFIKETFSDTSKFIYHVKGNKIRFDESNTFIDDNNYLIFDLENQTITAVSEKRQRYLDIPIKPYSKSDEEDFEIIKTDNHKEILGFDCYQWRVKNVSENTEIAYWIINDGFYFFDDFLKLWNRSEKHALYFLMIPEVNGVFPLLSVERTLLRDLKMKMQVETISRKKLDDSLFEIPEDYKSYYD